MSAKTSAARRAAFFTALAETGNQTISAERARVSRSWVMLHRSTDPAFKVRMEVCIAAARVKLLKVTAVKSPGKWVEIGGEELVMRGSNGRRAQVARARIKQWTARGEKRFLAVLSATCNVKLACREVGLSVNSAYGHRHRWPDFGMAWDAAVEAGYHTLETALMANAVRTMTLDDADDFDWEPDIPMEPISPEFALALLRMNKGSAFRHWAQKRGIRGWGHNRNAEMSHEELTEDLMKKLAVLRGRIDAGEA